MYKIKILIIAILNTIILKSQPNWDKVDLTFNGQTALISTISGICVKNDSTCYIKSSLANSTNSYLHAIQELNLHTGYLNIIDTNSIKIVRVFYEKPFLYGIGFGFWKFNFSTNKWDSVNNFTSYNVNKQQNIFNKLSKDTILIFGNKIAKLYTANNTLKTVCDSAVYMGGCLTLKNYYTLYNTFSSINKNYDSVFLMVSTDKGEHWTIRKRLLGNYDDSPILTFSTSDTGFVSYNTKGGSPPGERLCHVIRTRDGGLTWPDTIKYFQQVYGSQQGKVFEIHFLDKNVGFVSYGSSIFKTIDGGNIWYETQGVYTDGMKTFFVNDTDGYTAIGKFFPAQSEYILKTTNQGGPPFKKINQVGINNPEAALVNVKVYPNPNKGKFTVSAPGLTITGIKVYDNNNKLIYSELYNNEREEQKINLPEIATGVYYVHISTKEFKTVFTKFVVE